MIVTCERCATQFQLDDSRVPKRGVRVRCSRCKNSFRVVPEGQRAAEAMAALARRVREESQEEITQDLAEEDRGGDSLSRTGARPDRGGDGAGRATASSTESGASGSELDAEESDWKFNEESSGDLDQRGAGRADPKPDPPLARRGAQQADDWFSGGGDAALELDDRPWDMQEEESEVEQQEHPPTPPPPATTLRAAATEAPAAASADTPTPEPREEPEAPELPKLPAEPTSTDELDGGGWDVLAEAEREAAEAASGEAETPEPVAAAETAAPTERRTRRTRSLVAGVSYLARGFAHGANTLGWMVTIAIFGAGFHAGLASRAPASSSPERVAGLELAALDGRFVENAVSGALFVVSGRVRNPGGATANLEVLQLELLDAAGEPLAGRTPLHAPLPIAWLREAPAADLSAQPRLAGPIAPGRETAFEAVVAGLPESAAAFRIVESR